MDFKKINEYIQEHAPEYFKELREENERMLKKAKDLKSADEIVNESVDENNELRCKYCGSTHAVYWKTQVCIDCAFAHGHDK